eukprot:COSAG01_NODE_1408_length_10418_cov_25.577478_8_plen_139_part_00
MALPQHVCDGLGLGAVSLILRQHLPMQLALRGRRAVEVAPQPRALGHRSLEPAPVGLGTLHGILRVVTACIKSVALTLHRCASPYSIQSIHIQRADHTHSLPSNTRLECVNATLLDIQLLAKAYNNRSSRWMVVSHKR